MPAIGGQLGNFARLPVGRDLVFLRRRQCWSRPMETGNPEVSDHPRATESRNLWYEVPEKPWAIALHANQSSCSDPWSDPSVPWVEASTPLRASPIVTTLPDPIWGNSAGKDLSPCSSGKLWKANSARPEESTVICPTTVPSRETSSTAPGTIPSTTTVNSSSIRPPLSETSKWTTPVSEFSPLSTAESSVFVPSESW